jgi:hypothetical protein
LLDPLWQFTQQATQLGDWDQETVTESNSRQIAALNACVSRIFCHAQDRCSLTHGDRRGCTPGLTVRA